MDTTKGIRLRGRLNMLLASISLLVIFQFFVYDHFEKDRALEFVQISGKEAEAKFKSIVELSEVPIARHLENVSHWERFAAAIEKSDQSWLKNHVDPILPKDGSQQILALDNDFNLVYHKNLKNAIAPLDTAALVPQLRKAIDRKSSADSFAIWIDKILYRVSWTELRPETATESASAGSHGYYAVVQPLDRHYCSTLGRLTDSFVEVQSTEAVMSAPKREGAYHFQVPIRSSTGDAIARYAAVGDSDAYELALGHSRATLVWIVGVLLLTWVGTRVFLGRWTVRPLIQLSTSTSNLEVEPIQEFMSDPSEVGDLARSVRDFLVQRLELERLNLQFVALNQELLTNNEDLEQAVAERTKDLENAVEATIFGWSKALEARDKETEGHTQRVSNLAVKLARQIGMSDDHIRNLYFGAILHDIGKLAIPDSILLKPGELSAAETEVMKRHPLHAYEMLKDIPFLKNSLSIPLCHHEKWDGTGYPYGLIGEEIPLQARLFAIADVWDALRSLRPYHKPWGEVRTREYIRSQAGSHFDPELVEVYLRLEPIPHPSDWFVDTSAAEKDAA